MAESTTRPVITETGSARAYSVPVPADGNNGTLVATTNETVTSARTNLVGIRTPAWRDCGLWCGLAPRAIDR